MSQPGAGGYHWKDVERAEQWDRRREAFATERRPAFTQMLEAIALPADEPFEFVDLGAGDGKVAAVVLDHFRHSSAVLVDFSVPMMERGAAALEPFAGRYRYERWDMNTGPWPAAMGGPYSAIVSSAAVHHLDDDRKAWLGREVLARLAPGGVFANYDLFRHPAARFTDDQVHDRTCATLEDATGFLRQAGFAQVAVGARAPRPDHQGELALVVGKAAGTRC